MLINMIMFIYHMASYVIKYIKMLLFLVVIYQRYIAQCRLKSVGFTTSRKINSLRVLRN